MYTQACRLWFIGDYNLKPLYQIFSIDSNINLPSGNNFLYGLFWQLWHKNEQIIDFSLTFLHLSQSFQDHCTLSKGNLKSVNHYTLVERCIMNHIKFGGQLTTQSQRMALFYIPSCQTEFGSHIVKGILMTSLSGKPLGTGNYDLKMSKIGRWSTYFRDLTTILL